MTPSGIRFVGEAARLAAQAALTRELSPGRDEDVMYAARFQLRPRLGTGDPGGTVRTVLGVLDGAIRRHWEDAPPLSLDKPLRRPEARFHGLRWDTLGDRGAWTGELVWRHPHPVVAGAPCTTHVVIVEQHGRVELTVRVAADQGLGSVRGHVGAGQARPLLLVEMNRALRLSFDGGDATPRTLIEGDIDAFVRDVLLSETRDHPVAILAPAETGGYLVAPAEIAEELLGLAHLWVIDRHPATFRLTDSVGDRRLSVYWGALRAYMPGFTCADHGREHPLLIRDSVTDPVMRAELAGTLGRFAGTRIGRPAGVAERRPVERAPARSTPTTVPSSRSTTNGAAAETPATASPASLAPREARAPAGDTSAPAAIAIDALSPLLENLGARIGELAQTIGVLMDANRSLTEEIVRLRTSLGDEISRLRTTTAVRASVEGSLERRIGGLEQLVRSGLSRPDVEDTPGDAPAGPGMDEDDGAEAMEQSSLADVLRQAAAAHADSLLVLDSAERAAAESPYEDVERVAVILDAMAGVARRRQEGALGMSLRAAFRELGIEYRGFVSASTSEKHARQYLCKGADGRTYDCREHIVLGNSYDPRYCLRIYFTSRAPVEPRFVIGHVGRHFDVASTT